MRPEKRVPAGKPSMRYPSPVFAMRANSGCALGTPSSSAIILSQFYPSGCESLLENEVLVSAMPEFAIVYQ